MKKHDYNYCSNDGQYRDIVANTVINKCESPKAKERKFCDRSIRVLTKYLESHGFKLLNITIWSTKTNNIYKRKDYKF